MKAIIKNKYSQFIIRIMRMFFYPFFLILTKNVEQSVKGPLATTDEILKYKLSISRFGDGEFNIMYKKKGIGFQKYSNKLRDELLTINTDDKHVIAIPHGFLNTKSDKFLIKTFWWEYVTRNVKYIRKFLVSTNNNIYFDASFSRVITELKDKKEIDLVINNVKNFWNDKHVIVVEGRETRFGVKNDLFENTKSVRRVIAPSNNAYEIIDMIELKINDMILNQVHDKNETIVLIALGPTATALAYRLRNCVQAIDIGHFDLQYEFYRLGYYHKVKVNNRYDNESISGDVVDNISDETYNRQIEYDFTLIKEQY